MVNSLLENQKRYAHLLIRVGLNLQKGQNLILRAPVQHHDFVKILVEEAYQVGVREIFYRWRDDELDLLKYQHAPHEVFESYPQWMADGYTQELKNNCATLYLNGNDPELFSGIDPQILNIEQQSNARAYKVWREYISASSTNWLIAAVPNLGRAKKLYGEGEDNELMEKLRNQIFSLVRVDQDDPLQAWKEHLHRLDQHAKFLNQAHFKKLYYRSDKTNLEVQLPEKHQWMSAGERSANGIPFVPNMPTEEVFSCPHKNGVDGTVYSTRPLYYAGQLIENFSLTFKNGEVIDFAAEKGAEALEALLNTDPGARRLGEVAIVGVDSPIAQSGLVFFTTLFDENASCHFALGASYPTTVQDGLELSLEQRAERGMNESIVHVDFMVGDEHLEITGEKDDGSLQTFFSEGKWVV